MQTQTAPTSVALHETEIAGEKMIFVGPSVLIASKSNPGDWYIYADGACSCPSFTYRGRCRHTAAAQQLEEMDRAQAELDRTCAKPVEIASQSNMYRDTAAKEAWLPVPACSVCGGVWTVKISGVAYCGEHAPLRPVPTTDEERMARAMDYDPEYQAKYGFAANN